MPPVLIRPATIADLPAVRRICLATCDDPQLLAQPKVLYLLYADYYLNEEAKHCFVATLEGQVIGYVLASFDQKHFAKAMKEKGFPLLKKLDPKLYRREKAYLFLARFWHAYPAHLHVDIDPAYQHQGIGSRLIENLIATMRINHVKGVHLSVSPSHSIARHFYLRNGFKTLFRWPGAYFLGRKL